MCIYCVQGFDTFTQTVMDSIENLLSQLLKDKVLWYHGILWYSDFNGLYDTAT